MIQIQNLSKRFREIEAISNLSLSIPAGEIFGFLGPNGAGKTTTIKIMTGLLRASSGSVCISRFDINKDPIEVKKIIGFIPDRPFIYEKLTGIEFLRFIAGIYRVRFCEIKGIYELLELFELSKWLNELIESYSHGMKQKLVIASCLLHNPKVIIIDEPMVGLDPKSARIVKQLFKNLSRDGTTIFLSSHSLEIVEKICDRIGIIEEGRLIALGTMDSLREESKTTSPTLEDIFLKLTGAWDVLKVVEGL